MNKKELVAVIAEKTELTKKQVNEVVNAFTEAVLESIEKQEEIKLVGFGTFTISERQAKKQINPKTKEYMTLPARTVPVFKFSKEVKKICR